MPISGLALLDYKCSPWEVVLAIGVLTKVKEMKALVTGTYRTVFAGRCGTTGAGRIYKNGAAFGTLRTFNPTYVNYVESLDFVAGDLIQLYIMGDGGCAMYFYVAYPSQSISQDA